MDAVSESDENVGETNSIYMCRQEENFRNNLYRV